MDEEDLLKQLKKRAEAAYICVDDPKTAHDFADNAVEFIEAGAADVARVHILRGLEIAEHSTDFVRLATVACKTAQNMGLEDKVLGRKIFEQAVEKADGFWELRYVADEITRKDNLADTEWAIALYTRAEEMAENADEFDSLANAILKEPIADKAWAARISKKGMNTEGTEDA